MKHLVVIIFLSLSISQTQAQQAFKIIPLGVKGGIDESNLSSYLVAAAGTNSYIALDAGTLDAGLAVAKEKNSITPDASQFLKDSIKAYLISHPHLDHVAGLIINSPDDTTKNIYGLPFCIDVLQHNYFTWKSWANFADSGDLPHLNKYHYKSLVLQQQAAIENTLLQVTAFSLSHAGKAHSTAFLINSNNNYLLYLGDTGADSSEKTNELQNLWRYIAPIIKSKQLKGIFIETSYPNSQPDNKLFGHLTPNLLMKELKQLSTLTGVDALKNLPVIITHIKPSGNNETMIKQELINANTLQLQLIFPKQGESFIL